MRNPFTMDTDYCEHCRMGVEAHREFGHHGTEFVYRINCKRCGLVIGYGHYNQVPILSPDAANFVTTPQEDRT